MIALLIYLVGYIYCYRLGRYHIRKEFSKYTIGDRMFMLFFSIFSIFGCIVIGIHIITNPSNSEKEAKW